MPDREGILQERRIASAIKKIAIIFIVANALYLFIDTIVAYKHGWVFAKRYYSERYLEEALLFLTPTSEPLWYLGAVLQSMILLWIAVRTRTLRWLYIVGALAFVTGIVLGTWHQIFGLEKTPFYNSRNVLTVGLPFILSGILIRRYEAKFPVRKVLLAIGGASLLLVFIEYYLLKSARAHGDIYALTLPLVISTFLLGTHFNFNSSFANILSILGRRHSTNIYILHAAILQKFEGINEGFSYSNWSVIIVFGLALLLSVLIREALDFLKQRLNYKLK